MAASFLLRGNHLLRSGLRRSGLYTGILQVARRSWCTETAATTPPDGHSSFTESLFSDSDTPKYQRWDDFDDQKWKEQEQEILSDIEPVISRSKEILHSIRYTNGERLSSEDERIVADRLLAHHPHAEDKIGCGIESIMVDRHPRFHHSRCFFVIRTDGGWIDFSYNKCLQAYIRNKYPSYAEQFIQRHFKR